MKKIIALLLFLLILCLAVSACGEKAEPIVLPPADKVTSIEIAGGMEDFVCTDSEKIATFIKKASEAKPTTKQSIQDVPAVSEYTRVDFVQEGSLSSVFIYEEGSKWYVEQPYQGIYETDEMLLAILESSK